MKYVNDWGCFFSPYSLPVTWFQFANFSLHFVQSGNVVQRFFGDLANPPSGSSLELSQTRAIFCIS
jgi:hypothetical protein